MFPKYHRPDYSFVVFSSSFLGEVNTLQLEKHVMQVFEETRRRQGFGGKGEENIY